MDGRFKQGALVGAAGFAARTLLNFITLPILIHTLGAASFGVYTFFLGLGEFLVLLDFGFTQGIVQRLSTSLAQKNTKHVRQLVSMSASLYSAMTVLLLLLGLAFSQHITGWFNIPHNLKSDANLCMVLTLIEGGVTLIEGHFSAVLMAQCRYSSLQLAQNSYFAGTNIIAILMLWAGFGLPGIFAGKLALAILRFGWIVLASSYSDISPFRLRAYQWAEVVDLFKISVYAMIKNTGFLFANHADRFLIARYSSMEALGIYVFVYRFLILPLMFLDQALKGIYPLFAKLRAEHNLAEIRRKYLQSSEVVAFVSLMSIVTLLIAFKPIFHLFAGEVLDFQDAYQLAWIAGFGVLLTALRYPAVHLLFATDAQGYVTVSELIAAITKILASIPLVFLMGIQGPALANGLIFGCLFWFLLLPKISRQFQISSREFITQTFKTPLLYTSLLGLFLIPILRLNLNNDFIQLGLIACVYSILSWTWFQRRFGFDWQKLKNLYQGRIAQKAQQQDAKA